MPKVHEELGRDISERRFPLVVEPRDDVAPRARAPPVVLAAHGDEEARELVEGQAQRVDAAVLNPAWL